MKIVWFCIPAHGHTNPTLGLVKLLTKMGHEVYYFSFEMFRVKIESAGAHFIGCDGCDLQPNGAQSDKVGKDLAVSTELIVSSTLALDDMVSQKAAEIAPDIIVSDSVAFWGKLTAIKYNIPYVSSTTTFAFNSASAKYMKTGLGDAFKMLASMPKVNKQLKRLRDKGYPVKSILDIIQNDNDTNTIVYTSEYFQPYCDTFSDKYCFIGPSIRPVESPIEKTADKTVFISMGTVVKDSALYNNCIAALKDTGYQVIVSTGKSDVDGAELPDNVQIYEYVDQMAALSISDVFITHCGMNSASEGLYFGVPLILCPQTQEQEAVARRTEELGAGIRPKSAAPQDILNAAEQALGDGKYKAAAEKISDSFKHSGGYAKALAFLENIERVQ